MSPILLRPIREQFEHDRVIRQLQTRWSRKFEAAMNVGVTEEAPVRAGTRTLYPDLVLTGADGPRRLHGVVEVETAESVNHLEAKAEWAHFAKVRGAFYLYVPAGFTDVAERLCHAGNINVTEIWAYYAIAAQVKFSMAYRSPRARRAAATLAAEKAAGASEKPRKERSQGAAAPARPARKKTVAKTMAGTLGKAVRETAEKPVPAGERKTAKKRAPAKSATTGKGTAIKKRAKVSASKPATSKKAPGKKKATRAAGPAKRK